MDLLDRLRARPAAERDRIALVIAGAVFGVIFVVWFATFSSRVPSTSQFTQDPVAALSPAQGLITSVKEGTEGLSSIMNGATTTGADPTTDQSSLPAAATENPLVIH